MYKPLNKLNFYQLSMLKVPLNLGIEAKFETKNSEILKFKRYASDYMDQLDHLNFSKSYWYSGAPFLKITLM